MNNNTSNYQEYTFPKLLKQYDMILVPMIQRDYAQGREDKKAKDVRNNMLNDIFIRYDVNFDLIFGSVEKRIIDNVEKNCFIPVDGQQRLTTLFLVYLYGQKLWNSYQGLDLSKFSYDTRRAASDFCKSVTSEEWNDPNNKKVSDVIKDSSWFMDYWEKDPTVEGMLNMLDAIHEKCKGITDYPNLSKVKFYFFDLESNGLNENLYLKMNSRGKPLTAFENLKAKIEKVLPDNIKEDNGSLFPKCDSAPEDFKGKWKYYMDRDWAETFWDENAPEKCDVYIAEFIVRFLSGYWAAFGGEQESTKELSGRLKEINNKDNYDDFIPFEPIKGVLNLDGAFSKLAYALTTLIDNSKIKPSWSKESDKIKVSDKSEYKILTVVFTYVLFDGDKSAMRFAWNMAENYITGYDTYIAYCMRIKEIYEYTLDKNIGIYHILDNYKFENPSEQLKEEIAKAKQILHGSPRTDGKSWKLIIIEAEEFSFFKGAIRFLFTNEKGESIWDEKDYDTKWTNAQKYFDENGVKDSYKIELTKKLVIQCDDWGNQLYEKQIFNSNSTTWKWILCSENWRGPINNILTKELAKIEPVTTNKDSNVEKYFTPLLDKLPFEWMTKHIPNGRFRWFGPRLAYYKPHGREYILFDWGDFKRNKILSSIGDINTNHKINNGSFYWGWDIQFTYNERLFQWQGNNYVRLIEDLEKCEPVVKDEGKDNPEEKWFCFSPTSEMASDITKFTAKLDQLINDFLNSIQKG